MILNLCRHLKKKMEIKGEEMVEREREGEKKELERETEREREIEKFISRK
jgi:hypothetical protein